MHVSVRDSRVDDMPMVQRIYAHYVLHERATFEEEPPSVEEMERRRAAILERGLPFLVAESDGEVAGYSYATAYRPRAAYRFTIEDSVYVAHGMGRRGIGRSLLTALIARCERGDWRQMIAVIGDGGNTASIRLHESLGFRMVGTLLGAGFKFGGWIDTVMMQRPLGRGSELPPIAE